MRDSRLGGILRAKGDAELANRLTIVEDVANWSFQAWFDASHEAETEIPTALWVQNGPPNDEPICMLYDMVEVPDWLAGRRLASGYVLGNRLFTDGFMSDYGPTDRHTAIVETLRIWLEASYAILGETERSIEMKMELRGLE